MNQTSTIHSVDIGLIYGVLKMSFCKQCKIWCFNPLCNRQWRNWQGERRRAALPREARCKNWAPISWQFDI